MEISGSVALVTGAASGIGAGVARQLADAGATVVVADVQDDKGKALAAEIGGAFAHVDVTDTDQIKGAVDQATELGGLRIVVNSAGIGPAARTVGRDGTYDSAHDLELFKKVIAINLIGTFDMIRIAGTAMSRLEPSESGERGVIVNMASVAAFEGFGDHAYDEGVFRRPVDVAPDADRQTRLLARLGRRA
jgi:NAD(P)-dependent dehydrogenase (short-subunit alcohol dehydrogenase family)